MQTKLCLALVVAFYGLVPCAAMAQDAPVTLTKQPALQKGIDAFPRLAGTGSAIARINAGLDAADARVRKAAQKCLSGNKDADWSRRIDVTMAGPRFVSFVSHDDTSCGGPHPNTSTIALVYDLITGHPVTWTKLLPASLGGKPGTMEAADGTVLGVLSSPKLKALYIRAMKPDADCKDVLEDADFNFMIWPDGQKNGLVLDQDDLSHAVQACGGSAVLSTKTLRDMGADADLVSAIETSHAIHAASPAGSYTKHDNGHATLEMTDRGGQWEGIIDAGGVPNGGATAADCNFIANGEMIGQSFHGQIVRGNIVPGLSDGDTIPPGSSVTVSFTQDGATITQVDLHGLCAMGVDVLGRYKKDDR
jgi:hypothetical protein